MAHDDADDATTALPPMGRGDPAMAIATVSLMLEWLCEYQDAAALIQRLYEELPTRLGIDRLSILLYDPASNSLISEQLIGACHSGENLLSTPQPVGYSISGLCFSECRPMVVNDCARSTIIPAEYVEFLGLKSCLAVPLLGRGGPVGVMRADTTKSAVRYSDSDVEFFSLLGRLLGLYVENVRTAGERDKALESLRAAEMRYAELVVGKTQATWDWDLHTDTLKFSESWGTLVGSQPETPPPAPNEWFRRVHPDDLARLKHDIAEHLAGRAPLFQNEHRLLHANGNYLWALAQGEAQRDEDGHPVRVAGTLAEIADRDTTEPKRLHEAFHDGLTGLPNRAHFLDRLRLRMRKAARAPERRFGVVYLDLDRFKVVNDSLGPATGDKLLVSVARRLQAAARPNDLVAHWGGDKFLCLLDDLDAPADAERFAENLLRILALPHSLGDHEVFSNASFGIALWDAGVPGDKPENLLRNAELALSRAKADGRGRHAVYNEEMHRRATSRLHLEIDLRRALRRQELFLEYQPIVSLKTRKVAGLEVLLRWRHPKRGLVSPEDFVPVAEETGLIVPITRWVLAEVGAQAHAWSERFGRPLPFSISVNVSARHFSEPELLESVHEMLDASGCDPSNLILEITESEIMRTPEALNQTLHKLRELHIQLHVDDFGTGYSSLSYLQRFPIDKVKIDRSFVAGLGVGGSHHSVQIVSAIVQLAHNLKMGVIAEGIENERQLATLVSLGCDFGQGHLFSGACDADAAAGLVETLGEKPAPVR